MPTCNLRVAFFLAYASFRFEENEDIRVFRKEDEPCAKGLSQEDILKIKSELEKEI